MIRTRITHAAATVVALAALGLWWATGGSEPTPLSTVEIDLDQAVAIATTVAAACVLLPVAIAVVRLVNSWVGE